MYSTAQLDDASVAIRKEILNVLNCARRGHIGSAFSIIEIMRVLYEKVMRFDAKKPDWVDRDRFILSKGHGCLALYVMLARAGFIPEKELEGFCEAHSILGGHPQYEKIPGVEASTGSLGHGLPIGVGIALSGVIDKKDFRTFVLLGDGECNEGSVWEAAMAASKHHLNRLTAIVDYNKMQCYSSTMEVQDLEPFADKWRSFGFHVEEADGHDMEALEKVLSRAPIDDEKPSVLICHTIKGKGIPMIENKAPWHHKSRMSDELMDELYKALEDGCSLP
ncbi:MAG TPA: transketolase [Nitrospirae bacterium]|nr:transketolase [Nitrospirota bacterium]